jgi:hypothetical protein
LIILFGYWSFSSVVPLLVIRFGYWLFGLDIGYLVLLFGLGVQFGYSVYRQVIGYYSREEDAYGKTSHVYYHYYYFAL